MNTLLKSNTDFTGNFTNKSREVSQETLFGSAGGDVGYLRPRVHFSVVLFNQHLDPPHLSGGWILMAKEKEELTETDFDSVSKSSVHLFL